MRLLKLMTSLCFAAALVLPAAYTSAEQNQSVIEAPSGFDDQTNGVIPQNEFEDEKATFEERETVADGLGPVYNAQSCAECHQNPVTGGISQIVELRAGHFDGEAFHDHPGGSLINSRATNASLQERLLDGYEVRAFRSSLNILGDGFVEAIADETLIAIANAQPGQSRGRIGGEIILVPVLEAGGSMRVGRFGWKNQHASLVSFSADAYLNEMGVTSPLLPLDNTSNGASIAEFDSVADPESTEDVDKFARFMRSTKAPPRDEALAGTVDSVNGSQIFDRIGCAICHVRSITTAATGTAVNGGQFIVPSVLGDKVIHPFSDFLLHNVGTGDGIVQNGGASTRNKLRTPPLWGVRTRNQLMHDAQSLSFNSAILRHSGEASSVVSSFRRLSDTQRNQLIGFLRSL